MLAGKPHLIIPYSIQNNDVHLAYGNLGTGQHFYDSKWLMVLLFAAIDLELVLVC